MTPTNARRTAGFLPPLPGPAGRRCRWLLIGLLLLPPVTAVVGSMATTGVPGSLVFSDPATWLQPLGSLTGILALAWLLLALMLSIRLPGLDQPLGGMLGLWRVHHYLGAAALLSALLHPLFLLLASAPQGPGATLALLQPMPRAWPLWTGWLALGLMLLFLAPSFQFFGRPAYQRWKLLHLLAGPAALIALAHGIALARWLSPQQAIVTWGLLGSLAAVAFFWRKGLSPLLARRPFQIDRADVLANGVIELTLSPLRRTIEFTAGQFVYLTPDIPELEAGNREEHPYTISSAPAELPTIRIGIKSLGDASWALQSVAAGERVYLEGPYGRFLSDPAHRPQLWIGGGIGLTPFVSAARQLSHIQADCDITLIYCANDITRAYYLRELQHIAEAVDGLRVIPHFYLDQGYLNAAFLRQAAADLDKREAYVCGPVALIELTEELLTRLGTPRGAIHTEAFDLL